MVQGENTTVVEYDWHGRRAVHARTAPADRLPRLPQHHPRKRRAQSGGRDRRRRREAARRIRGCRRSTWRTTAPTCGATGDWYRNFEYDVERERGLDYQRGSVQSAGTLTFDLRRRPRHARRLHRRTRTRPRIAGVRECSLPRRRPIAFTRTLVRAADQFIVRRGERQTVIAGYHWFTDWGRDTMIALPGPDAGHGPRR